MPAGRVKLDDVLGSLGKRIDLGKGLSYICK